jgi:hypothetical protein
MARRIRPAPFKGRSLPPHGKEDAGKISGKITMMLVLHSQGRKQRKSSRRHQDHGRNKVTSP